MKRNSNKYKNEHAVGLGASDMEPDTPQRAYVMIGDVFRCFKDDREGYRLDRYLGESDTVTIPETVTRIEPFAFKGNKTINSVTIPDSVTEIGFGAFCDCYLLERAVIPKYVKVIEGCLFYNCSSLTEVWLPDGIEEIEAAAFARCDHLKKINIPASVKRVGDVAFESFNVPPELKERLRQINPDVLFLPDLPNR